MTLFSLEDLAATIDARAAAEAGASYTRTLLDKGAAHCARKFGEEAVEAIVAATSGADAEAEGGGRRCALSLAGAAEGPRRDAR